MLSEHVSKVNKMNDINTARKEKVIKALDEGIRYDGRGLLDFRSIEIKTDISVNAEGSASVKMGDTELLVGVKMGVEKPYPDSGDEAMLMVNTELLPLAGPEFETGPPSIDAIELSRVTDRMVRESGYIDRKKLCITPNEKVWGIFIDICTVNYSGNLFDPAALGAIVALRNVKTPAYKDEKVDYKKRSKPLPLGKNMPVSVTVYKIGKHLIIDPNLAESQVYDARLTVSSFKDGTICAMQKGGVSPLNMDDISRMVEISQEKGKELRKLIEKVS